MLAKIKSYGISGISGYSVLVEVDVSNGLPSFSIVGLPDAAVKESLERVRSAMKNSGFTYPAARITVNLAPADVRKEGPIYDLPMAAGLLCATGQANIETASEYIMFGELSLNGDVRPVNGVLPMAIDAHANGCKKLIVSAENANEASYVEGLSVYPVSSLSELAALLTGSAVIAPAKPIRWSPLSSDGGPLVHDFSLIRGQAGAKRALEIAAAGGHNVILIGPPGAGKTMLAQAITTILPELTFAEALEITKIHSITGKTKYMQTGIVRERPFRSPHHSASIAALTGGGINVKPGEVSLAHFGVLFLDELPEFRRDALEALRQPVEDGTITISRANANMTYPASFMLVASMNPCPCGHYGTDKCRCTPQQIRRYLFRISGPLLDRIDMHIEVPAVTYDQISSTEKEETSAEIKKRVDIARTIQLDRFRGSGIFSNSQMDVSIYRRHCSLKKEAEELMQSAFTAMNMSARAYGRILKVSRTIADLDGSDGVEVRHVAEAIQYRSLDRKYWGADL